MTDSAAGASNNPISALIPRGSLGLKLLLVCILVLAMGIPIMLVGAIVGEREQRAHSVTAEIGAAAGGSQVIGGPMLLVPYTREVQTQDNDGRVQRRTQRGDYIVYAQTGSANAALGVEDRRLGIYRAAIYKATVDFKAEFAPATAMEKVAEDYRFDWDDAKLLLFVSDSRAIQEAVDVRFGDGTSARLEPYSGIAASAAANAATASYPDGAGYVTPTGLQVFAADAPLKGGPANFTAEARLVLSGAERFALAAFAQDTTASIRGDRSDTRAEGYFQPTEALNPTDAGFVASWSVPFVRRDVTKAADLVGFDMGLVAQRDMAVRFVASDDIYTGVARAVRYGIMFIGIVFLATLIFEAVSGRKAHPAQYILVGLAQCVFYLLLLSMTEIFGFEPAFFAAATATVLLLAYYAGVSFKSAGVGVRALLGLAGLYGAMYVLMTLEDYALLAGSAVAFVVIAATMIATRGVDWYGRGSRAGA